MDLTLVNPIINALLYEGYLLYPYRASAIKNRQPFNFGTLFPQVYCEARRLAEPFTMRTECLIAGERPAVEIQVRFLHLVERRVERLPIPVARLSEGEQAAYARPESLQASSEFDATRHEAVEREMNPRLASLPELAVEPNCTHFDFPGSCEVEPLSDTDGLFLGAIARRQLTVASDVKTQAERLGERLWKVAVEIRNSTPLADAAGATREAALRRSLASTHTILGVQQGEFISLLDPPPALQQAAAGCNNVGAWPVLVGDASRRNLMLSSSIIVYDYPQVAPESAGDFFDGTEIDELLTLRVMTLTDEEKREMRRADDHGRRILERTEALPPERLMNLHGALRAERPQPEQSP